MGKTYKDKQMWAGEKFNNTHINRNIKLAMKAKRKKYKLAEFPDGNLLNKHLANRWDWD